MLKRSLFLIVVVMSGLIGGRVELKVPGSLSARFVHSMVGNGVIARYSGKALVNRSRAFRLEYRSPGRQLACNLNDKAYWIDYATRSAVRYNVGSLLDLMQILKVARYYKGNLYKSNYHGYHFILRVNTKGEVNRITFRDKDGVNHTIQLSAIRYTKRPLPSSRFRCSVPGGYRMIQGRI
jgi:hypothetical protein